MDSSLYYENRAIDIQVDAMVIITIPFTQRLAEGDCFITVAFS